MKIRNGFVSNSSSSSFVVIDYKSMTIPDEVDLCFGKFGECEFGWGPDILSDFYSRVNFAYIQSMHADEWLSMLKKVLSTNLKVDEDLIEFCLVDDYTDDEKGERWGYIDHQSCAGEGQNMEIFDSEHDLTYFLFGTTSHIVLDHDNY